jgi:hypothetical protein
MFNALGLLLASRNILFSSGLHVEVNTSRNYHNINRFSCAEGSSLGNIVKGCWVFPLFEKGFPKITSCVICMVILLVILVYCSYYIVALFMVQVHAKLKRNYMCLSHH